MVWQIALNVWLLFVGLDWMGDITAKARTLGIGAIVVVIIFIVELLYSHRATWFNQK